MPDSSSSTDRRRPDGVAFRYAAEPGRLAQITDFVDLERQCCPFLTFRLIVEPAAGPIWLELAGPAGTREFLAVELGQVPPA